VKLDHRPPKFPISHFLNVLRHRGLDNLILHVLHVPVVHFLPATSTTSCVILDRYEKRLWRSCGMINVLCCVLGSSGDVLSLINVVHEFLNCEENQILDDFAHFHVITHRCHTESFLEYSASASPSCKKISYIPLQTSPVSLGDSTSAFEDVVELSSVIAGVLTTIPVELIFCNLFCLEGWLVANKVGIPCIIIHPTVPLTNQQMRDAIISEHLSSGFSKDDNIPFIDYELWLWPTLTDKYDNFLECFEKDISCLQSVLNPPSFSAVSIFKF
jgi:hypothetical protein